MMMRMTIVWKSMKKKEKGKMISTIIREFTLTMMQVKSLQIQKPELILSTQICASD